MKVYKSGFGNKAAKIVWTIFSEVASSYTDQFRLADIIQGFKPSSN